MRVQCFAVPALLLLAAPLAAQSEAPASCTGEEHRRFDFWVGDWTVVDPAGDTVGWNRIERISNGCGLLESWTSARGTPGRSVNFYDPSTRDWHQVWVGAGGVILRLRGDRDANGAMVLMGGERQAPNGVVRDRITWTPRADGSVEQKWEIAPAGSDEWRVTFLGRYLPARPARP